MYKLIVGAACACFMVGCSQTSQVPAQSAVTAPPALLSGIDVQYIDDGVRAQDDFYKHVNGKWLASTEIPADKASYGSFDNLIGDSEAQLRGIVEGLQTSGAAKDADNRFARTPCRSEEAPCRRFHPGLFAGRLQATAGAGAMLLPA
jgi:hypothetical protein